MPKEHIMTNYQFIGVDVSKDKFDISLDKHSSVFQMNKEGFKKFITFLRKHTLNPWVCMEATGYYSEILADYLYAQKIRVSVINPLQIKRYAQSQLVRNKNDILDAKVIEDYGKLFQPRVYSPRSQQQKEIRDLVKLLDQLKGQSVQLKNQLSSTQGELAKKLIKKSIATLDKNIELVIQNIDSIIKKDPDLLQNINLLNTVKGIGDITSYKILGWIPDLSQFSSAKQFAAFIGVTPKQNQSGRYQGKTVISKTGNPALRKALYMAALVAKRFNEHLQPFVRRLKEANKAPKAIVCAVMRKLAHIIFGILKHQTEFNPKLV
jgi:transposase